MDQNIKITCGIYLFRNDNKFLVGHPTNFKPTIWSIPKGRMDEGETDYFEVAKRELLEESNIDYNKLNVTRVEELPMLRKRETNKYLKGFFVKVDSDFSDTDIKCDSMVYYNGVAVFPEFDAFKWVTIEESKELLSQFNYIDHLDRCNQFLNEKSRLMTFEKFR